MPGRSVLPACRWPRLEVGKYRSGEGRIAGPRRRRSVVASPCISLLFLPSAPVCLSAAAGTGAGDGGARQTRIHVRRSGAVFLSITVGNNIT